MKKLNLAVIGQGRSGRNIHGAFYLSENNTLFEVAYVVDADEHRRELAAKGYDVNTSVYTVEAAKQELLRVLGSAKSAVPTYN